MSLFDGGSCQVAGANLFLRVDDFLPEWCREKKALNPNQVDPRWL